jgi:glycine cleavage system aminomethyltransferase T
LQGPHSVKIMQALFGESITDLRYYWLREYNLNGIPLIVSRTGWSSEIGYELYLQDGSKGDELWETIMAAGAPLGLQPGHTSTIRRIEGGMLSYHADMDINTNPYELDMDRLVALDIEADFIGKSALKRIRESGVSRKHVGLLIDGPPLTGPNSRFWALEKDGQQVGKVTSAVFSPRLELNIALAMVGKDQAALGTRFDVQTPSGKKTATVVEKPFFDPRKKIAAT